VQAPVAHDNLFKFLPDKYSFSLGYGLSPRPIFGQENVYREAVRAGGAVHWNCVFLEKCTFLLRTGYLRFLAIPGPESAIKVEQLDSRFSAGLGMESTAVVPAGISMSTASVARSYRYKISAQLKNESIQSEWSESAVKSVIDLWMGVPLVADMASLNLTMSRFLSIDTPEDQTVYGVEFRFDY
ncbi:MAG: hypothetical protein RJB13_1388, partial [Pseudomonadota bacterium]